MTDPTDFNTRHDLKVSCRWLKQNALARALFILMLILAGVASVFGLLRWDLPLLRWSFAILCWSAAGWVLLRCRPGRRPA